jgi:hypothetical protein
MSGDWVERRRAAAGDFSGADGEPCLAELLDDPIMTLLWRRDGLDRATALATLHRLQALVQQQHRGGQKTLHASPSRSSSDRHADRRSSLAAEAA